MTLTLLLISCAFLSCISPSNKNFSPYSKNFLERKVSSDFVIALEKAESIGTEEAIAYILNKYPEGDTVQFASSLLQMEPSQAVSIVLQQRLHMPASVAETIRIPILFKLAVKKANKETLEASLAYILSKLPTNAPIEINEELWKMKPSEFVFTIFKKLLPDGEAEKLLAEEFEMNANVNEAKEEINSSLLEELCDNVPKPISKRGKKKNKQKSKVHVEEKVVEHCEGDIEIEINEQDGNEDVPMSKHKSKAYVKEKVVKTCDDDIGVEINEQDANHGMQKSEGLLSAKEEEENALIKILRAEISEKQAQLSESQKQKETLEEQLQHKEFEIKQRDCKLRESRLKRESLEEQLKAKDDELSDLKWNFKQLQEEKDADILQMKRSHLKHIDRVMEIGSLRYFSVHEGMERNGGNRFDDLENKAERQCYTCAQSARNLT